MHANGPCFFIFKPFPYKKKVSAKKVENTLRLVGAAYHDIRTAHHRRLEYFHLEYQQLTGQLLRKPLRYQSKNMHILKIERKQND